jgi:hypothetical protein
VEKSEAEIDADMKNFVEGLRDKLLELSGGYPIFSTSSVVSAKSGIVDLTDEILAQFSLAVDPAFDQFLKKP